MRGGGVGASLNPAWEQMARRRWRIPRTLFLCVCIGVFKKQGLAESCDLRRERDISAAASLMIGNDTALWNGDVTFGRELEKSSRLATELGNA